MKLVALSYRHSSDVASSWETSYEHAVKDRDFLMSPTDLLCERFAEVHQLTVDYVYAEFLVDVDVNGLTDDLATLDSVTQALDPSSFLVYDMMERRG